MIKDISNQKFERLKVIDFYGVNSHRQALWNCECECGNKKVILGRSLISKNTLSCGCYRKDIPNGLTHGLSRTKIYSIWNGIKQRCNNINDNHYKEYGERGITLCKEWEEFLVFQHWALNNGYLKNLTVDRIDNNKGYFPENCRFATRKEQANNRRSNHLFTINGETKTVAQWSDQTGINKTTIRQRINKNDCPEIILFKGDRRWN